MQYLNDSTQGSNISPIRVLAEYDVGRRSWRSTSPERFHRRSPEATHTTSMETLRSSPTWLILAIASGACASFNGVFAKLYVHSSPFRVIALNSASEQYIDALPD